MGAKRQWMTIAVLVSALTGCTNIGPKTVSRDRFDYNMAIADSWKEQTLLNIVKLRYADMPLFVEVASVVSGYTLEGSVNLGGTVSSKDAVQGDFFAAGAAARYTDRPTITYAPITGAKFNKSFMTPVPPRAILFLMQSGWQVDTIFAITVDAINGLRSRIHAGADQREGDPGYYRVIELLRKIQRTGAVGMRIKKGKDEQETTVLLFHRKNLAPEVHATLDEVSDLLGLDREGHEVEVTYGLLPESDREMAMLTRSTLQIMIKLAAQVDVPPAHVEDGRTLPSLESAEDSESRLGKLITVHNGTDRPEDAFAAVRYEDHWFWIDKRDFKSKRTFSFLMILFSLTETGAKEGLPLVTIPAG
jgi:hypothetical protein